MTRRALVADLFCGAGGSSTGARRALRQRGIEMELVAVNHWPIAIETHQRNHPDARHYCTDIESAKPEELVPEGRLDLLMASPTCTYHSRARGGRPIHDQQRMDPWHVVRWCTTLRVKRLLVENVPEFIDWGPIDLRTGRPIKRRRGEYFRAWVAALESIGMRCEWAILNAADYGDATTRRRFFLIGRSDGRRLRFPEPTHSRGGDAELFGTMQRWRPAREIIDWSLKGRSIFNRKRPLSPKTLMRIHAGAVKLRWPEPYIVVLRNHMADQGIDLPLPAICAGGNHIGLAEPVLVNMKGRSTGGSAEEPAPTITAHARHLALAEPFILNRHGDNGGVRAHPVDEPMPTADCRGAGYVVEPFVLAQGQGGVARPIAEPLPTIPCGGAHAMVTPYYSGGSGQTGKSVDQPLDTITTKGRFGLAQPILLPQRSDREVSRTVEDPLPTITTVSRIGMVVPVTHGGGLDRAHSVDAPLPTLTCASRGELAFITPGFGERDGQAPRTHGLDEPAPTICAKGRLHLVEPGSAEAVPAGFDILFRMLEPHELAAATGFSDDELAYEFVGNKTEITRQIGNAVPVNTAAALVAALMEV